MKFAILFLLTIASTSFGSVQAFNSSDLNLGNVSKIKCGSNVTCAITSGKLNISIVGVVGTLVNSVAATATTITAAQCGTTFYNTGAVQMELPVASAGLIGCRLTFATANATNFDINPDNAAQILVETNAVGDAMRNATLGNTITIQLISATQWAPISVVGTWTDIN